MQRALDHSVHTEGPLSTGVCPDLGRSPGVVSIAHTPPQHQRVSPFSRSTYIDPTALSSQECTRSGSSRPVLPRTRLRSRRHVRRDLRSPPNSRLPFSTTFSFKCQLTLSRHQIEVVKCRAQIETLPRLASLASTSSPYPFAPTSHSHSSPPPLPPPQKQGSYKIALRIAREQGLRGFYVGGLMTACHDGISSGVFFCSCESSSSFSLVSLKFSSGRKADLTAPRRRLCLQAVVAGRTTVPCDWGKIGERLAAARKVRSRADPPRRWARRQPVRLRLVPVRLPYPLPSPSLPFRPDLPPSSDSTSSRPDSKRPSPPSRTPPPDPSSPKSKPRATSPPNTATPRPSLTRSFLPGSLTRIDPARPGSSTAGSAAEGTLGRRSGRVGSAPGARSSKGWDRPSSGALSGVRSRSVSPA